MEQVEFLLLAAQELDSQKIPWMVVGSYATSAWGEARFTQDIDIVIDLQPDQVASLCSAFPSEEFYVSEAAARDALRSRKQFNVIHPASGNKIDFMIARQDEWGRSQLERRRTGEIQPGVNVQIASPEDVIISKMRYFKEGGSDKHLRDCAGVVVVQAGCLDLNYILHWAGHFGLIEIWDAILKKVNEVYGSRLSGEGPT
jgi:hypothetical protein